MYKIKIGGIYIEEHVVVCVLTKDTAFCMFENTINNKNNISLSNTVINAYISKKYQLDPITSKVKILKTQQFSNYAYLGQLNQKNLKYLKTLCNLL